MCKAQNGYEDRCWCDNCGLEFDDIKTEHARYKSALDDVYGLLGIIYDDICDEDLQGPPGHAITVGIETINTALSGKEQK